MAFHVLPRHARYLVAHPVAWGDALKATLHISDFFPLSNHNLQLHAFDASGGTLNRFSGDGWLACGDAALSFDPISSEGIFFALYSGMISAAAVNAMLDGHSSSITHYSERIKEIRRFYISRRDHIYRSQSRWLNTPFWSCQNRTPSIQAPSYLANDCYEPAPPLFAP